MKSSPALLLLIPAFILGAAFWHSGQDPEPLLVSGKDAGYVNAESCRPCHSDIYETYQHTGMGRSFYRDNKRVSNTRLKEELGVTLAYPTYRDGLRAMLAAEGES